MFVPEAGETHSYCRRHLHRACDQVAQRASFPSPAQHPLLPAPLWLQRHVPAMLAAPCSRAGPMALGRYGEAAPTAPRPQRLTSGVLPRMRAVSGLIKSCFENYINCSCVRAFICPHVCWSQYLPP